jgi:hypothetical protein
VLLVGRRAPAAVDDEPDPVAHGIRCGLAQGTEEGWIEVGYTRDRIIEDRRAGRDGTVRLAKLTTVLVAKTTRLAGRGADG